MGGRARLIETLPRRDYRFLAAVESQWRAEPPSGGPVRLAVLPFDNLSGDTEQEYFSDGLTEEMITQLACFDPEELRVIARTSMRYRGSVEPLDQIAAVLGVQYLLEGSVRRAAQRVRITAQLIRAKDQCHLWAHTYDRDLGNILHVQAEVARAVAPSSERLKPSRDRSRPGWECGLTPTPQWAG